MSFYWFGFGVIFLAEYVMLRKGLPERPLRRCEHCQSEYERTLYAMDMVRLLGLELQLAMITALIWPCVILGALKGLPHFLSGNHVR